MHLLALFLIAAPAAQPVVGPPPPPAAETYPTTRGTMGVSFFLPNGGDFKLIGGTYFFANDLAARIDFGLNAPFSPGGTGQNTTFSATAALRSYQLKREHVGVFLEPIFGIGREPSPAVTGEVAVFFRVGAGVGVEYFFTNHFSAGATLELSLKVANLAGPAATPTYTTLSTASSSLAANIYF